MKMEAETGGTRPQSEDRLEPPGAGRGRKDAPLKASGAARLTGMPTLRAAFQNAEKTNCCSSGHAVWSTSRTPVRRPGHARGQELLDRGPSMAGEGARLHWPAPRERSPRRHGRLVLSSGHKTGGTPWRGCQEAGGNAAGNRQGPMVRRCNGKPGKLGKT